MEKKSITLERKDLIATILEIPSLKERGWSQLDLEGHTNLELIKLYEDNEPDPCFIAIKPSMPASMETTWGYS